MFILENVENNCKFEDGIPFAVKRGGSQLNPLAMGKTQDARNVKELGQWVLTLDRLRLKRQKQKVDQNEGTRLMRLFYYTPICRELFD